MSRRLASAAFVTLLALAVFWPSPVVSTNLLWIGADLDVDHLSFLGREAPSWDVAFWCLAGLLLFAILQSAQHPDPREPLRQIHAMRAAPQDVRRAGLALAGGVLLTLVVWIALDAAAVAWAERIQSDMLEDLVRLANRLGGGMNPVMIVVFFLVAGVVYSDRRWVGYSIAMAAAGLTAGLAAQIVKHLVGRARPELWLGTAHWAPGSSTSFPSGHTVGAFALAGVLVFASRSPAMRVIAFALAAAVGLSRVLAFRHWLSDVTASAVIGLTAAWLAWRMVRGESC